MRFLIAFLILSAVILFHELGHFLAARANGIKVLEFAFGMGPKLFSFQRGDTVYAWKLLPFGGSCMMLGEDEAEDAPGSFNNASVRQRFAVIAAGPLFNFLLALLVSFLVIGIGGHDPARVEEVPKDGPAYAAGLREGDIITRYEGNGIANGRELYADLTLDEVPVDLVHLTFLRDGKKESITYAPETVTRYLLGFYYDPDGKEIAVTQLTKGGAMAAAGLSVGDIITSLNGTPITDVPSMDAYFDANPLDGSPVLVGYTRNGRAKEAEIVPLVETHASLGFGFNTFSEKVGFGKSVKAAFGEVSYFLHVTLKSLRSLLTGRVSLNEISGPVGVVSAIGSVYEEATVGGFRTVLLTMLNMLILLTANLGVMNLLPFPALDGGRLVFLVIEGIRGKPVNREIEGRVHLVGIMILLGFMFFITAHDILKLF